MFVPVTSIGTSRSYRQLFSNTAAGSVRCQETPPIPQFPNYSLELGTTVVPRPQKVKVAEWLNWYFTFSFKRGSGAQGRTRTIDTRIFSSARQPDEKPINPMFLQLTGSEISEISGTKRTFAKHKSRHTRKCSLLSTSNVPSMNLTYSASRLRRTFEKLR